MLSDDTYIARRLQLLGEWDAALAALGPDAGPELRAEIAVDRWFFQIEGHEEAEKAVAALDPASPTAHLLTARLAYSRLAVPPCWAATSAITTTTDRTGTSSTTPHRP